MTITDLFQFLSDAGVIGLLLLIVVGGLRRWYVFGWAYDVLEKDRDYWRTLAIRGTSLAERVVNGTER